MSFGPFQHLQSSHDVGGGYGLACEPWVLPITDKAPAASFTTDELKLAVRKASRPFWLAANGVCAALGLFVVMHATGMMGGAPSSLGPVASAAPPTISAQTAAYANASH